MEPQQEKPKLHPLPGFCWMWPVGSLLPLFIGSVLVYLCARPTEEILKQFPRGDVRWLYMWLTAGCCIVLGIAYWWFWFRFAVRRQLSARTWHTGTALIIAAAVLLFFTGWITSGFIYLLVLAVWTQGNTKQIFSRA